MVPTDGNIVGTWGEFILAITTFANFGDRSTKQVFHSAIHGDFYSLSIYVKAKVLSRRYRTETCVPYEDGQIIGFIHSPNLYKGVITRIDNTMTI